MAGAQAVLQDPSGDPNDNTIRVFEPGFAYVPRRYRGHDHEDHAALHRGRQIALRDPSFRRATSEIKNPDGSIVFHLDGFDVPEHWSQVAADILAQKYFRKAGVARRLKKFEETQVPSWLWRSVP